MEVVTAMIEDGADVNGVSKTSAMRPLTMAAISGDFNIVKALALAPGVSLDAEVSRLCSTHLNKVQVVRDSMLSTLFHD